uniref:(northern house mosquito) hypothetical protein n=1 Tax=Culex pipiens TaxID=7175 RepID=A0A8D8BIK2_CULPI
MSSSCMWFPIRVSTNTQEARGRRSPRQFDRFTSTNQAGRTHPIPLLLLAVLQNVRRAGGIGTPLPRGTHGTTCLQQHTQQGLNSKRLLALRSSLPHGQALRQPHRIADGAEGDVQYLWQNRVPLRNHQAHATSHPSQKQELHLPGVRQGLRDQGRPGQARET